jgi:hypothetical protein
MLRFCEDCCQTSGCINGYFFKRNFVASHSTFPVKSVIIMNLPRTLEGSLSLRRLIQLGLALFDYYLFL